MKLQIYIFQNLRKGLKNQIIRYFDKFFFQCLTVYRQDWCYMQQVLVHLIKERREGLYNGCIVVVA